MKKKLIKFVTLMLVIVMALTTFACDLVKVDMEKAKEETVATVKVFENGPTDVITNGQIYSVYLANGAYYIYTMGYTPEETLDYIVEELVKTKIKVQVALNYFNNVENYADLNASVTDVWDVKRYLTDEEIAKAEYNVKVSINDTIDSFMDEEEEDEKETYAPEVRTSPTNATPYEHELSKTEMEAYKIDKGFADGSNVNDTERRNAYYKLLKSMSESGYIDDDFDWDEKDIATTDYYTDSVKEQMENILVTKYESYLLYDYYKTVSIDTLKSVYEEIYATKTDSVKYADFNTALTDASATNPVLYNHFSGRFGYVYNLLIPMDAVQTERLEKVEKDNVYEYRKERETILKDTVVTDLRDTWITSNYDFELTGDTATFINDFAIFKEGSLPFNGKVEWVNKGEYERVKKTDADGVYYEYTKDGVVDEDYEPEFKATANKIKLDDFVALIDDYLYGTTAPTVDNNIDAYVPYYRVAKATGEFDDDKVNELLFAFSTDSGSLNTYKGYVVSYDYDIDYNETFVEEFATAGRYLLDLASAGYTKSYVIVASDYGYHVMIFNELVTDDSNATNATLAGLLGMSDPELETAYNKLLGDILAGELEEYQDSYLYTLQQAIASEKAAAQQKRILDANNKLLDDENKVVIDKDVLAHIL